MSTMFATRLRPRFPDSQSGIALLLTLLVFLILAAIVSELMISTRLDYEVAKSDASMTRLDTAAESVLLDALDMLVQDGEGDASSGGGIAGAAAGAGGLPGASGDAAGGAQQGPSDSGEDEWAKPFDKTLGDARVSVWIEDENRKFNILALLSPDENYAKASFDRLVRILDRFREETDRDLDSSQAETLAIAIRDYMLGTQRPDRVPRPALLTDIPNDTKSLPMTLDELLLVEGMTPDLLFDQEEKIEGVASEKTKYPGLCSFLTVWTSIQPLPAAPSATNPGNAASASGPAGNTGPSAATPSATGQPGSSGQQGPVGVKINVNFAPRELLKSLLPPEELPSEVVEGIVRYRNFEREEAEDVAEETGITTDAITGEEIRPREFFASIDDLKKVPEFANFPDEKAKDNFRRLLTTRSDVFSIHLTAQLADEESAASGEPPGGEDRTGKLTRRIRAVFWRRQGNNGMEALPIVRWEMREDRRIVPRDFAPEEMPRR